MCCLFIEKRCSNNSLISRITQAAFPCYHSNRRAARFMKLEVVDVDDVGNIRVVFYVGWW